MTATNTFGLDAIPSPQTIWIVPIHKLRHTPYNPASRTKEGAKLQQLKTEIANRGLIYPILITDKGDVIDGNRRLAACRSLGHDDIRCIVSGIDRDQAFTVVNTTALAIGGKGWLEIGLGGGYMPEPHRKQYNALFSLVGEYGIKELIDKRLGLNVLLLSQHVCSIDAKYDLAAVVMAIATRKLSNKVNAVMRAGTDRKAKVKAMDDVFKSR